MAWSWSDTSTDAFNEWQVVDQDIRAFVALTGEWSQQGYDRAWERAGAAPGSEDGPAQDELFHDRVGGLWPLDYEWMVWSAAVKDAVTAYEVYLEKVLDEALAHHRLALDDDAERAPFWGALKRLHKHCFEIDVDGAQVKECRALRHLLTHRRGELRTEAQRKRFASSAAAAYRATLDRDVTFAFCDTMAAEVRRIDAQIWAQAFAGPPSGRFAVFLNAMKARGQEGS